MGGGQRGPFPTLCDSLESAWLTSAQATHCLDMEVKGDVEELPQNPVQERVQLLSGTANAQGRTCAATAGCGQRLHL